MISFEKLEPIIAGYKAYFPIHWEDEKYKWEAIKHFQDHWNIDAENFGDMFKMKQLIGKMENFYHVKFKIDDNFLYFPLFKENGHYSDLIL